MNIERCPQRGSDAPAIGNIRMMLPIPGTEDLMPYIYGKTLIGKWLITLVGYPAIAALLSLIMSFLVK